MWTFASHVNEWPVVWLRRSKRTVSYRPVAVVLGVSANVRFPPISAVSSVAAAFDPLRTLRVGGISGNVRRASKRLSWEVTRDLSCAPPHSSRVCVGRYPWFSQRHRLGTARLIRALGGPFFVLVANDNVGRLFCIHVFHSGSDFVGPVERFH